MKAEDIGKINKLLDTQDRLKLEYDYLKELECNNTLCEVRIGRDHTRRQEYSFNVSSDPFFRKVLHRHQEKIWGEIVMVRMQLRELGVTI